MIEVDVFRGERERERERVMGEWIEGRK